MEYQKITVAGLLVKNGKALIIRRSSKETFLSGYYELPGEKVDFGEHPIEALKREFMEEVGLGVEVLDLFRVFTYISDNGSRHTVELVYHVASKNHEVTLSLDHDDFKWVSLKDTQSLNMTKEIKKNIEIGLK